MARPAARCGGEVAPAPSASPRGGATRCRRVPPGVRHRCRSSGTARTAPRRPRHRPGRASKFDARQAPWPPDTSTPDTSTAPSRRRSRCRRLEVGEAATVGGANRLGAAHVAPVHVNGGHGVEQRCFVVGGGELEAARTTVLRWYSHSLREAPAARPERWRCHCSIYSLAPGWRDTARPPANPNAPATTSSTTSMT